MARYSGEWPVLANWICIAIVCRATSLHRFVFSPVYNGKCHHVSRCYGWTTVERWFIINIIDGFFTNTGAYVCMEERREREREMVVRAECQELQGYEIHSASFCVLFYELRYVRRAGEIIDEGLVQGARCRRFLLLRVLRWYER